MRNLNLRTISGFIISAVLLWLTFHKSGLKIEQIRLNGSQWLYFIMAMLVFVCSLWFYAIRAKLIWANETQKPGKADTYSSIVVGNFYNCLLPGNLGDGIRAWHFSRKQQVPFSSSLSVIVTEKWIDAQMFVLLTLILFAWKPFTGHYIFYAIGYTCLAVLGLSILYALMLRNRQIEKAIWSLVIAFRRPGRFLFRVYRHTSRQISSMKKSGVLWYYLFIIIIVFLLNLTQFFLLLKTAGVAEPVNGTYSAYLLAVSMMIIAFIPSAPGNIGVLHYGFYVALILSAQLNGIEPDSNALQTYALVGVYVHLSYFIPEVLMGIVYVMREREWLFDSKHGTKPIGI